VCGAAENLLIDKTAAGDATSSRWVTMLLDANCEVRGDERCAASRSSGEEHAPPRKTRVDAEYEDAIISARVVDGVDEAIALIARYGSHHTDAIVTDDTKTAEKFLN